jgi:MFS family permease
MTGLFAQYAPYPTTLVFEAYLAVLAVAGLCLLFIPETVRQRRRPALRFAGLGIPDRGRGEFIAAATAGFTAFSVLGLFSALAPTFLQRMHEHSHATAGAVVFVVFIGGTLTQLVASRFPSRRVVMAGLSLLLAGLALIVAALAQAGLAMFLAGAVVAGVAAGAVFVGSLASANRLAPPRRRAQAISVYFLAAYCGLIIPVVGVGVAAGLTGDFPAVLALAILLAALCLFALAIIVRTRSSRGPRKEMLG